MSVRAHDRVQNEGRIKLGGENKQNVLKTEGVNTNIGTRLFTLRRLGDIRSSSQDPAYCKRGQGRFSMSSKAAAEPLFQIYYVIEWRRMLGI